MGVRISRMPLYRAGVKGSWGRWWHYWAGRDSGVNQYGNVSRGPENRWTGYIVIYSHLGVRDKRLTPNTKEFIKIFNCVLTPYTPLCGHQLLLAPCLKLQDTDICSLKSQAVCSSERPIKIHWSKQRRHSDHTRSTHYRENVRSQHK
jgi:hypothetical protein